MKTIMQGRDNLNKKGSGDMKKIHVQIIALIMLMSVSTEYLQASGKPSGAPKTASANSGFAGAFKKKY